MKTSIPTLAKKITIRILFLLTQNKLSHAIRFIRIQSRYFIYSGLWKSTLLRKPMNQKGDPLPWLSVPAIEFLNRCSFQGCNVLELGSGQSTLYWQERAQSVTSLEHDHHWLHLLRLRVKKNVTLKYWQEEARFNDFDFSNFEIVVIDGLERGSALDSLGLAIENSSKTNANPDLVILDNANWFPRKVTIFRMRTNFIPINFIGFAPSGLMEQDTCIFVNPQSKHANFSVTSVSLNRTKSGKLQTEFVHEMDFED